MNRIKQLRRNIARYEKRQPPITKYLKEEYILDNDRAEIYVDLTGAELYHPLSVAQQRELAPEIYEYIDEKAYPVPVIVPIKLRLLGVPADERSRVESIIRKHYDLRLRDKKQDMRLNSIRAASLFIIGAIMLAVYFVLSSRSGNVVWHEIFSIVATFIVWEAADYAILIRRDVRAAYLEAAQMALTEIEFTGS